MINIKKVVVSTVASITLLSFFSYNASADEENSIESSEPLYISNHIDNENFQKEYLQNNHNELFEYNGKIYDNPFAILEVIMGNNPIYFPSKDIDGVIREGKVVGEQYLRVSPSFHSQVKEILKDGTQVHIVDKIEDITQSSAWYKVEFEEIIEVKVENKVSVHTEKVVGFINPEHLQIVPKEVKQDIQMKKEVFKTQKEQELTTVHELPTT